MTDDKKQSEPDSRTDKSYLSKTLTPKVGLRTLHFSTIDHARPKNGAQCDDDGSVLEKRNKRKGLRDIDRTVVKETKDVDDRVRSRDGTDVDCFINDIRLSFRDMGCNPFGYLNDLDETDELSDEIGESIINLRQMREESQGIPLLAQEAVEREIR